jgi:hypothetical protein
VDRPRFWRIDSMRELPAILEKLEKH